MKKVESGMGVPPINKRSTLRLNASAKVLANFNRLPLVTRIIFFRKLELKGDMQAHNHSNEQKY